MKDIKKNKVSKSLNIQGRYRVNKPLYDKDVYNNIFSWGGQSKAAWEQSFGSEAWSNGKAAGAIGDTLGSLGTIINSGVQNADAMNTTGIQDTIKTYGSGAVEQSSREALTNQWTTSSGLKTDYDSSQFRTTDGQRISNTFNSTLSGALTGAQIGGPWGALAGGVIGLGSGLIGIFEGNRKAREEADKLNNMAMEANIQRNRNYITAAENLDNQDFMLAMRNYSAFGGPIENLFANGGSLSRTHGSDFTNGVTYINEGGTHEENPNGGVQIGVDSEGKPNLVEEGEVVFNDYVFSNRLYAKGGDLAKYNLPDKYDGYTFAKIATELFKESEESPNDPISLETLKVTADRLRSLQEEIRAAENADSGNQFADGGFIIKDSDGNWIINEDELKAAVERVLAKNGDVIKGTPAYEAAYKEEEAKLRANLEKTRQQKQSIDEGERALKRAGYSDGYIKKHQHSATGVFDEEALAAIENAKQYEMGPFPKEDTNNATPYSDKKDKKPASAGSTSTSKTKNTPADNDTTDWSGLKNLLHQTESSLERSDNPIQAIKGEMLPIKPGIAGKPEVKPLFPSSTPEASKELVDSGMFDEPAFDWANFGNQALRYAPVIANIAGLLGNKKDYSDIEVFENDTRNPRSVKFTPIGGQYDMNLVSPWEMQNPILQASAGTRRTLANSSLGNSVAMNNAILASDAQTQGLLGQALLQGKEYNNNQRRTAAEFRRGVDQYNSTGSMQAQSANMGLNDYFYNRALNKYNMRNAIDMGYTQAQAGNATALANNLGNIGKENILWDMANENPGFSWGFNPYNRDYYFKGLNS